MLEKSQKKDRKRWRRVRRLAKMTPYEVAAVSRGANKRPFAVIKEDESMSTHRLPSLDAIQKAHDALSGVVNVMKAGTPDAAATEALFGKIDSVMDLIGPPEPQGGPATNVPIGDLLKKVIKELASISQEAQGSDYAMADRIDAVTETVQSVSDAVTEANPGTADTSKTDNAAAAPADADTPAAADAAAAPKAEDDEDKDKQQAADSDTPAADPAPAPSADPAPAAADASPAADAQPADAAPAPADPPADPAPADPPADTAAADDANVGVTKADLKNLGDSIVQGFKDFAKELVSVQKSRNGQPVGVPTTPVQATTQIPTFVQTSKGEEEYDPSEEFDLAASPDLEKMDRYGRY